MSTSAEGRSVLGVEIRERVACLTLQRPEALNAVSLPLASALADTLRELPSDGSIRAILITGAGRAFCAGGDIRAMAASLDDDPRQFFAEIVESLHAITMSLLQSPVPTVAAVNGAAAGFGCGLALSCDLIVASERASFSMAHGQVGQIPDGGGWYLLPRIIGAKRALDLYLTRRRLDAKTAESWGIASRVFPPPGFREQAFEFALELSQGPSEAFGVAKKRLADGFSQPIEAYLEEQRSRIVELGGSPDFAEGVRAFLERREPEFRGSRSA